VGASQLPFHYLLSLKSPYSPLHLLLGTSHESLITTHQLLGHIITALFWAHVVLYFNFYILKGLLLAKLQYLFIICGVVAIIAFTAIGTTALRPLRDWSYRVFYITHVTLATALLPILWLHVEHIQPFIYETAAIYAVSVALRWVSTNSHTATITKLPGTNLVEIVVPMAKDGAVWQPGQHAYVSVASHPLLRTFRSNPFTVASIPANDKHLRFVVRLMDGSTAKLAHAGAQTQKVMVEGPYGLATHAERLLGCDRVLLVAGGVGATFIVPLYRQLLADLSPSRGSYRRQKVRFVWAARKRADVEWAVPAAGAEKDSFCERLSVYVTGEGGEASASASASSGVGMRRGLATADEGDDDGNVTGEDGIELEERKTLLAEDEAGREGESGSLSVMAGRPDVGACIDEVFSHGRSERVAVVVCGPYSLSHRVRTEVAGWVGRGRDVWFWDERFAT
jgi:NAD(P)H-flavin reductase